MPQLFDHSGRLIETGTLLGKGGEGSVYEIATRPREVAKLYNKPVPPPKQRKLDAMVRWTAPPDLVRFAAWPTSTLHESRGGKVIGITMPRVTGAKDIHLLYGPAQRRTHFPTADWHFLLHTARNCAVAFHALHSNGIVIGDVNHGNVLVSSNAIGYFIDCDSYQYRTNGEFVRCEVGVPDFTPPELQRTKLGTIDRTPNHDCFGLALLIFRLLCVGRHPFSGRFSGTGDLPLQRAISEHRYAYSRMAANYQLSPPPGALPISALPQKVADYFEQAFGRGSATPGARPTAHQWAVVLDEAEKTIATCSDDKAHKFARIAGDCPWCKIEDAGGTNFFISVSVRNFSTSTAYRDPSMLWAAIVSVNFPDQLYETAPRLAINNLVPRPLPPEISERRLLQKSVGWVAFVSGVVSPFGLALPAALSLAPLTIAVVFAVWWFVLVLLSPRHRERAQRHKAHRSAESKSESLQSELRNTRQRYEGDFQQLLNALRDAKRAIEEIQREKANAMQKLKENVRDRQLAAYLDNFYLDNAKIKGIGSGRVATLISYGIETAADIETNRILSIPGFGPSLTSELLVWRDKLAAGFRFDPSKGVPQSEIQALEIQFQHKQHALERKLNKGPESLRGLIRNAANELRQIDEKLCHAELSLAQTRADLSVRI